MSRKVARLRSIELLSQLRIPEAAEVCKLYPHQLSGGMKQRIVIAMALAADPDLIIADEPTTALDVTVQAQIIELLVRLVRQRGMALMLITHDMGVIAQACDRVVVLYAGRVAESNEVHAIFEQQNHPYTQALIRCIPRAGMAPGSLKGIPGSVPSVASYGSGCRFHSRCPMAADVCSAVTPEIRKTVGGGYVACHFSPGARAMTETKPENLVAITGLNRTFTGSKRLFGKPRTMNAVSDVSLRIPQGSVTGVVGEFGMREVDACASGSAADRTHLRQCRFRWH